MRVKDLMTRKVSCCSRTHRLNDVSHIMWQEDCGAVPVVDSEHRILGIVTDRDVCMAAYTTGRALRDLAAEDAMSRSAHCCTETDAIGTAHRLIRKLQVRRLPVVDGDRRVVGLIGLGDLARAATEDPAESEEFAATFAAVSRARKPVEARTRPSDRAAPAASAKAPARGAATSPASAVKTGGSRRRR